jgi:hypothetical protein
MKEPELPTVIHCEDIMQYFTTKNALLDMGYIELKSTTGVSRGSNYLKLCQLGNVKMFALCAKSEWDLINTTDEEDNI